MKVSGNRSRLGIDNTVSAWKTECERLQVAGT